MRAAPTALCIIFCLNASAALAQKAPDFTVDVNRYGLTSSSGERSDTMYPELGTPLMLGTFEIRPSMSTQFRTSLDTNLTHEERFFMTEVRAPVTNHPRLQLNAKVLVPIKKSDPVPAPYFVDRPSGNPYEVRSKKTKAEISFGISYRFGPGN